MPFRECVLMGAIAFTVLSTVSCDTQEALPPVPMSPLGEVSAESQRPGDPVAGYQALVNYPYVSCGVPYSAYQKNAEPVPLSHRLPGREGRNQELPYRNNAYVTERGVELVTSNCFSCHAAFFNGQLVLGLGNESMDFTYDPVFDIESLGAYVTGEAEAAEWRKWADRMAVVSRYMITDTVGVNPAVNVTLALMAHRDPETLAWSDQPLMEPPPTAPLPVSVPPWWRMKKKHAMFYNTEGRGDHARIMILAATLCTDSLQEAKAIDAYAPDINAYIASLEPPEYPFAIDDALAQAGKRVFDRHCARCHGTYGEAWTYPNRVVAYQEVGTDPELARLSAEGDADRFIRWFNDSFFGELARAAPAPGYIAPPLDGVWATAPYLHNGSVPSIAVLLESGQRPKYWLRSFDASDYNTRTLGWNYSELAYGKSGASDPQQRKRLYDTSRPGYSNQGHTYGDVLSEDERKAVIEYLKTL